MDADPILSVRALSVRVEGSTLLERIDFDLGARERLALIGPSGAGKTVLLRAILGLCGSATVSRSVGFAGTDLLGAEETHREALRGRRIGVIPQNAAACLAPHRRVVEAFRELLEAPVRTDRSRYEATIDAALHRVGLTDAARVRRAYPWQLSGGEAQRVVIAMALAQRPAVLLADEPSSALDRRHAREILDLLASHEGALVLVAHAVAGLAGRVDTVAVMHEGRLIEHGAWAAVTRAPRHPYTAALLEMSLGPRTPPKGRIAVSDWGESPPPGCRLRSGCARASASCASEPPGGAVRCWHPLDGTPAGPRRPVAVPALDQRPAPRASASTTVLGLNEVHVHGVGRARLAGVSLSVASGECVGVLGASGAGKSTLCQVAVGLVAPAAGGVVRAGEAVTALDPVARHRRGHRTGFLEQDPSQSLNPRATIAASIAEPLGVFRRLPPPVMERVYAALARVGLPAALAARRPSTLSGGEAQRVALARALIGEPDLLVLDEPTSALDALNRARLANAVLDVLGTRRTAVLVVSHDEAFVRHVADRIVVLDQGRLVADGAASDPSAPP